MASLGCGPKDASRTKSVPDFGTIYSLQMRELFFCTCVGGNSLAGQAPIWSDGEAARDKPVSVSNERRQSLGAMRCLLVCHMDGMRLGPVSRGALLGGCTGELGKEACTHPLRVGDACGRRPQEISYRRLDRRQQGRGQRAEHDPRSPTGKPQRDRRRVLRVPSPGSLSRDRPPPGERGRRALHRTQLRERGAVPPRSFGTRHVGRLRLAGQTPRMLGTGSTPTTWMAGPADKSAALRLPVPLPTSRTRSPSSTPANRINDGARRALQRPMKRW